MNRFVSEDKKTINLPVELGTTLFLAETKCGDFCLFQKELFNKHFPDNDRCGSEKICHTRKFRISEFEFTLANLTWVLENWETKCFTTQEAAEEALSKKIQSNIEKMRALGFKVDEDGYSGIRTTKKNY